MTGDLPECDATERKRVGERGRDKGQRKRQGTKKRCSLCSEWKAPDHMFICTGRGGPAKCDLFDSGGNRRCGRCTRAYANDKADPKTEGLHALTCVGATCDSANFDCEHYTNRLKRRK